MNLPCSDTPLAKRSSVPADTSAEFSAGAAPLTMKPVPSRAVAPKSIPREYPHPSRHASFARWLKAVLEPRRTGRGECR
jgi:hypothetical protein